MRKYVSMAVVTATLAVVGCATEVPQAAPESTDESLGEQASVTSGSWTATPNAPVVNYHYPDGCIAWDSATMTASASFTGPAGQTRKMGVCLLQMTGTSCTTVADCGSSPATLPTGGSRYCTAADGSSTKKCAFRAGTQAALCAGSPALGGAAVAPGTYTTPAYDAPAAAPHVSYACFEGCATTDPAVSSSARTKVYSQYCIKWPESPQCWCF